MKPDNIQTRTSTPPHTHTPTNPYYTQHSQNESDRISENYFYIFFKTQLLNPEISIMQLNNYLTITKRVKNIYNIQWNKILNN